MRVVLVDDHALILHCVKEVLGRESDIDVVAACSRAEEVIPACIDLKPDVVVMDLRMGNSNGIDETRKLLSECPDVKVIGFSQHDEAVLGRAFKDVGGSGFVSKASAYKCLPEAIRAVANGGQYYCDAVKLSLIEEMLSDKTPSKSVYSTLSPRERTVLQLIGMSRTASEIACELEISEHTVRSYIKEVKKKLGVSRLPDLVKIAMQQGLCGEIVAV